MRVAIGLGANVGKRRDTLRWAIARLGELPGTRVSAESPFYESEPVDKLDQPWFINGVVLIETSLSPHALLDATQAIEIEAGRTRKGDLGPRVLDLDILFSDETIIADERLRLPHPRLHLRRFVLVPLCDVAADWRHPIMDEDIETLLKTCPDHSKVRPIPAN